uniref:Uncharacterized protein n=1 Tax=Anopheles minimus TaxID=112268 RepID=A0A182WNZ1_9DIPT
MVVVCWQMTYAFGGSVLRTICHGKRDAAPMSNRFECQIEDRARFLLLLGCWIACNGVVRVTIMDG